MTLPNQIADSLYESVANAVGGRWDGQSISWPDGQRVYLEVGANGNRLEIINIRAEPEGSGAGSEVLKALQGYASSMGLSIQAQEPVLAPGFFEKHDFDEGMQWTPHQANILDPIHDELDPRVWDKSITPAPVLKLPHSEFIYETILTALDKAGYDGMEKWLSLVFTGSLTTYQYSDSSDCDISLFVDTAKFPEWSRAEMIGVMVTHCDGTTLPGTPFPLQNFVVPPGITREDLYKPGMRSGYEMATNKWIVPPEKSRVHDVEAEMNASYTMALEAADKMDRLLRYEPDKAISYWHQIHKRRQASMKRGDGDYSPANIVYKMLANRGLFPALSEASGEHIAHASPHDSPDTEDRTSDS